MYSKQRIYLSFTLKVLLLIGVGIASIPFIASLRGPEDADQSSRNPWRAEVDLSVLKPGMHQRIAWPGGEVWVYHRTVAEINSLDSAPAGKLRDPDSSHSQQPLNLDKKYRSIYPQYFVFLAKESIRGCQVTIVPLDTRQNGFAELCFGARYDVAGRVFNTSGRNSQRNLTVPPHEFITPVRLRLLQHDKTVE